MLLLATRMRRLAVTAVGGVGLAICVWALQVYMPLAGKHWGMREAVHAYYAQRTIYGQKLVYFGPGELWDDWHDAGETWRFETFIPEALQVGQPMTIIVELNKAEDERIMESTVGMVGTVTAIGDHDVTVTFAPGERAKLAPLLAHAGSDSPRGRPPVRAVDADRLISWQLYWRGEAFWSGDEITGWLPEMKTSGPINTKNDNVDFLKYMNDRTRAPLGGPDPARQGLVRGDRSDEQQVLDRRVHAVGNCPTPDRSPRRQQRRERAKNGPAETSILALSWRPPRLGDPSVATKIA